MNQIPSESNLEGEKDRRKISRRKIRSEIKISYASTTALTTDPMLETSKTATRQSGSFSCGGLQRGRPIIRLSLEAFVGIVALIV